MKKGILLTSLLVLSIVGCTNPILNNTSQYSDLDKEYSQFKTEALTQSYLKKKMDKWLSDSKYSKNLVREIEYAKFKHKDLLKDIVALQPTMFNNITGDTGVTQKRSESSFETYIQYINPFPSGVTATSATNIASTSFTANWNSVTNATGYKLYIDGIPITLGNVTTYNVTGLVDASSYSYYVKATNSAGESSVSNTINVTLPSSAPVATTATNITSTSFTANWNSVTNATGYKLYLDGSGTPITLGIVTTYNKTGLTKGTSHNYYVKAVLSTGDTTSSNTISLYTSFDEFKVNSFTANIQSNSSIAMNETNGDFVITWQSQGQDGDNLSLAYYNIYAQRFNSDGSKLGSEFRVNTYTTNTQSEPSIAMADNGRFVITWHSQGQDGDVNNYNIYAQKYNADGSVNGSEFRVNSYNTNGQYSPAIAMAGDGKFVITWYGEGIGDSRGTFAKRYNADGSVNGSEFKVNTYTTNLQDVPVIAMADDGKFVISWISSGQDGDGSYYNVYAQKYNSDGSTNGSEFRANTYTTGYQYNQSIAMNNDGKFIISWHSQGQNNDGENYNVYAQRYNTNGTTIGSEFLVNSYTTGGQYMPSVAMSDDGKFIITWFGNGLEDSAGISAKRYNSDGTTIGSEFLINSYTTSNQNNQSIVIDSNGNFVVTWEGFGMGDSDGIFAKRFDSNGNVL